MAELRNFQVTMISKMDPEIGLTKLISSYFFNHEYIWFPNTGQNFRKICKFFFDKSGFELLGHGEILPYFPMFGLPYLGR